VAGVEQAAASLQSRYDVRTLLLDDGSSYEVYLATRRGQQPTTTASASSSTTTSSTPTTTVIHYPEYDSNDPEQLT